MKRTVFGMATLLLLSISPCVVNAFTAIAWSESGQRGGSVKQAPTKEAAMSAAIADCKKNGGGSDCQVFKVTDEPGFVALYASCAKTCGVTAVTGRATAEQARADGKRDCEAHYRNACQLAQEWEEIGSGGSASNPTQPVPENTKVGTNGSKFESMGFEQVNTAALNGDLMAQYEIARRYIEGRTVNKNPDLAIDWMQKSADAGYVVAQNHIARLFHAVGKHKESFHYYLLSANQGSAEAYFNIALAYDNGWGVQKDTDKYKQLLLRSAENGWPAAQFLVGTKMMEGSEFKKDSNAGFQWLVRSAEGGFKSAKFVAIYFHTGEGGQKDLGKATYWYEKALADGDDSVVATLLRIYKFQQTPLPENSNFMRAAKRKAESGDAEVMEWLGRYYLFGPQAYSDVNQALKWIRMSADKGNADAQALTSALYMGTGDKNGKSLKFDLSLAGKYADLSAKQGNAEGLFNSGLVSWGMSTVEGLSRDMQDYLREQARSSLRKSADKGHSGAKEHLCKHFRERC